MKKISACILALVLLASALPLAVMPTSASLVQQEEIPCDADANNELTKEELVNAILQSMLGESSYTLDDVGDAAWVYAYWDGKPKTIVDSADRTVTIYRPVERVVIAYWVDAAITLKALKAEDTVVGVTQVIKDAPILFPKLSELPSVGLGLRPQMPSLTGYGPRLQSGLFLTKKCSNG